MSRLDRITDWEKRAEQARWRASALAASVGISRQWLALYVRKHVDLSLKQWLRSCRITAALGLLRPDKQVKDVAFELGFKHVTHFSRYFKRAWGITPSKFLSGQPVTGTSTFQKGHKLSNLVTVSAGLPNSASDKGEHR